MGFQIAALQVDQFRHLFGKDSETLSHLGVERVVADSNPGFPCRVSLQNAAVGESVLLLNYEHQPAASPFRASHAIFVREWASEATLAKNEIPLLLRQRLLSVRAFDGNGMMLDANVVAGEELAPLIDEMFAHDSVNYLHVHNAKPGCYAALVERG